MSILPMLPPRLIRQTDLRSSAAAAKEKQERWRSSIRPTGRTHETLAGQLSGGSRIEEKLETIPWRLWSLMRLARTSPALGTRCRGERTGAHRGRTKTPVRVLALIGAPDRVLDQGKKKKTRGQPGLLSILTFGLLSRSGLLSKYVMNHQGFHHKMEEAGADVSPKAGALEQGSPSQTPSHQNKDPSYLEPPDVRQQLSHYKLASHCQTTCSSKLGGSAPADGRPDGVLTCEFCEFSSGYMQSLRRHYRDRHGGKKLFKCKDCSFFSCCRNTFTMHVEAGHNNSPPQELLKDLRCPLCLYHTRHKSNMIDHIVLHREERVAPLEVSRSKLSRHLQGLVFRCHKCTFTCSSDQSLQMHLQKHEEVKPYQCQLCYYDSSRRSQLEEHLRLEHKVLRNFELMGRVNLDKLEKVKEQESSTEEDEERDVKEMLVEGQAALQEEEEEEEEEEEDIDEAEEMEDDDKAMVMLENMEENQRELDGGFMEENIQEQEDEGEEEEEEEEEEREEEGKDVVEEEKPALQEVLASPSSSTGSGPSGGGKRLPCEFCGRCFTNSLEWERHVLRHGMVVGSNRQDASSTSAEASAPSSTGSSVFPDTGSNAEEGNGADQSPGAEDKDTLDAKTDEQFG
ncbi:zinc finger protein 462 [Cololabis saira]|uniref:zinc finger protein 462 n=1 Tax=Cololabis saira TaxID=129043 RepID=UPI002AD2E80D|nr:zinc finger protein 462 [Cololabis saira]